MHTPGTACDTQRTSPTTGFCHTHNAAVVGAAPGPGTSLVLSPYRPDGRGGIELRAWPEGRLWPLAHVHMVYAVWVHVVARGCTACNWVSHGTGMVELCKPGLFMNPAVTGG